MPPFYGEEATTPLVDRPPSRDNSNNNSKNGLMVNRILVIVLMVALVIVSFFFESQQTILSQQLKTDEEKIHTLTQTVEAQGHVIQRFNQSVTNSDVLTQLQSLEDSMLKSQSKFEKKLEDTVSNVQEQLDKTLTDLDHTVKQAEAEIKEQVETVKKDFEQYVITTQDQFSMENSFMVYQLAGTFTLLSCLISMWHMTAHLRKFNQPVIQRKILAILWMSPIYAVTSWFSLVFPAAEGYLAIIKDAYEAYVIYQFLSFCVSVLGKGDRNTVVDLLTRRADHLTPPFRLCFCCNRDPYEDDHALAEAILMQCQVFAMQFVFFRPATTIAKVMLAKYEYYGPWGAEGPNDYRAPQFYVTLIQNFSIFVAFTGLLKFYHAVDKDLEWCRPFAKFLCIKGVVFMTFWQGLAITILAETTDVGRGEGGGDPEEWASSAQNFLICLEMLLFSIAHFYCFPTEEWEENYRANFNKSKFGDTMAMGDFFADLKLIMARNKGTKKHKKKQPSEPTVPEGDEADDGDNKEAAREIEEDGADDANDDDDTYAVMSESAASTSDIDDPEKALANALAGNLSEHSSNNPEVEEARQRILATGFLEEMMFMVPTPTNQHQNQSSDMSSSSPDVDDRHRQEKDYDEVAEEETSERTGLLSGTATTTPSPLRPSIFTTVADIADRKKGSS